MVGINTGGDIGIQIFAFQTRGMAVDLLVVGLGGHDLGHRMAVGI